jgi:GNAT superfamily N-acetyltransferase
LSTISPAGAVTADGLSIEIEDVRAVELRAAEAWPETSHQMLAGWRLRHSPGVANRRANSVLPLHPLNGTSLDQAIMQVEDFYREQNLPARFMISPACEPSNLDQELATRGYHIDAPTDVQWAQPSGVTRNNDALIDITLTANPDLEWMSVYMEGVSDRPKIDKKMALIERIQGNRVLARLIQNDESVCVGLGVERDGWTGIFCMHTLHQHRRRGYARDVLVALANWGLNQGAHQMYLQVERDNPTARTFYERCGFMTTYGYHYRTKES